MLSQRPEWADVKPIEQDDGETQVCAIAYTPQFKEVMDYFRAIVQADERSERALEITKLVIDENAANYTAWYYRAMVLESLGKNPRDELEFVASVASENAKNYQIWHHRRVMIERLTDFDGTEELEFTTNVLDEDEDSKNYHAWAHRQWVLKRFNLWHGELEYIDSLLQRDWRNNSAWNQRYFVVDNTTNWEDDVVEREIDYAFSYIKKSPNNQSPWNYLRGVCKDFAKHPAVKEKCEEIAGKYILCAHVFSLLCDVYEAAFKASGSDEDRDNAIAMCRKLSDQADCMRAKYWTHRAELLKAQ